MPWNRDMSSNAFKFALLLAAFVLLFSGMRSLQGLGGIDVQQAQTMLQHGAMLLDVREPDEYSAGHAPGALLMPLGQVEKRMQKSLTTGTGRSW